MTDTTTITAATDVPLPRKTRNTVVIQCALPHGLLLDCDGREVRLNGANSSTVIGRKGRRPPYGLTEVDADWWDRWYADHRFFAPVVSGAIQVLRQEMSND
jgi:hypothetical protein